MLLLCLKKVLAAFSYVLFFQQAQRPQCEEEEKHYLLFWFFFPMPHEILFFFYTPGDWSITVAENSLTDFCGTRGDLLP